MLKNAIFKFSSNSSKNQSECCLHKSIALSILFLIARKLIIRKKLLVHIVNKVLLVSENNFTLIETIVNSEI